MIHAAIKKISLTAGSLLLVSVPALAQSTPVFTQGNLVVLVEGCGVHGGTCTNVPNGTGSGAGNSSVGGYGDNQAAPITLFQYAPGGTTGATFVNSLVLPQTASGADLPLSGEYGSSSEGTMQLSGGGQYLTLMGYGINSATFDAAYAPGFTADPYGAAPSGALAQSGSLTGQSYTPVPRVLTLVDANGNVNTATGIENIFNTNNPRSAYTLNGTTAYVSGQGTGADATGGVFYVPVGTSTTSPTAITGLDTTSKTIAQDTRDVQIYNNTLYVSVDSKEGSNSARDFVGTLGTPPATSLFNSGNGPTELTGFATSSGKVTITSGSNSNGNGMNAGLQINISPVNYFFASPSVLYVADSGNPKNNSANSAVGNGGLEKWVNSSSNGSGTWSLAYTLYSGLGLVANTNADGTTGVYAVTGKVAGNTVQLYATNYTLNDLDPTYLFGITDNLTFTTASQASAETFTVLDTAPSDSNFKGVSFAPTIPAGSVEITSSPSGFAFTSTGTGCAPGTYITPVTLAWTPGNSCTLKVATPQLNLGVNYGFVQWTGTASSSSTTLVVTAPAATGTYTANFAPLASVSFSSVSHNFGSLTVGTSTSGSSNYGVKVTNTSSSAFTFTGISLSGSNEFSDATNCKSSLAAGASCEILFSFAPTGPGSVSATWSISGTVAGTAFTPSNGGTLTGTGIAAGAVTLTTAKHNFGKQTAGTKSAIFGAVLTNSTSAAITIQVAAPTGNTADFTTTGLNCGTALAAGASCNLQYEFSPATTGNFSEFIGITANGGATPVTAGGTPTSGLTLVGTGD